MEPICNLTKIVSAQWLQAKKDWTFSAGFEGDQFFVFIWNHNEKDACFDKVFDLKTLKFKKVKG